MTLFIQIYIIFILCMLWIASCKTTGLIVTLQIRSTHAKLRIFFHLISSKIHGMKYQRNLLHTIWSYSVKYLYKEKMCVEQNLLLCWKKQLSFVTSNLDWVEQWHHIETWGRVPSLHSFNRIKPFRVINTVTTFPSYC